MRAENSVLTVCQNSSKFKIVACPVLSKQPSDGLAADAERLSEAWPSE